MKDFYKTLGLAQNASLEQVKSAYKKLALKAHPDRGGSDELMGLIIDAYNTLSDPDKRRDFDKRWTIFQETSDDASNEINIAGKIDNGSSIPFSYKFRKQYESLLVQYSQTPLNTRKPLDNFDALFFDDIKIYRVDRQEYTFLFDYIAHKVKHQENPAPEFSQPQGNLNPIILIDLFTEFLKGNFFGTRLDSFNKYLTTQIDKHRAKQGSLLELQLYEGVQEITLFACADNVLDSKLLFSIKKITDFAKKCDKTTQSLFLPLFYGREFRSLLLNALLVYWNTNDKLFETETLQLFDAYNEARKLCEVLRSQLSYSENNDNLIDLIRYINLLSELEKSLSQARKTANISAAEYRERAFNLLDWFPAISEKASRKVLINFFLQIGIIFQQVALLEESPITRMADEQLALKIYLTAIGIAHHHSPDVALYVNSQALKYMKAFNFADTHTDEIVNAIQKSTMSIANVFPFFEDKQTNIAFIKDESNTIHLMRQLLNFMVGIFENKKSRLAPMLLDHSAVTILYETYEGCLKNWFQERFDPEAERKFRLDLMEELLNEYSCGFGHVEENLSFPKVMVERDEDGWLNISKALPGVSHSSFEVFKAIRGAEIDHKTGKLVFFFEQWTTDSPDYEKSFTLFDMQEMIYKNISGAYFSLDPADPNKPYHPFNLMRFAPSQLHESEFLNTMLLTDYILKFLTTGQEVQGIHPFDQRPITQLIAHLPEHLRKIIDDFHQAHHYGSTHRFWIEAEEVEIISSDEPEESISRIAVGDIRMVIKKHQMKRDIHGELKDIDDESEGWPIYLLSSEKIHELKQAMCNIEGHALIYVQNENRVVFWENNQLLLDFIPKDFQETILKLSQQTPDEQGKIKVNTKNQQYIYQTTREICQQANIEHRYSPEFIFAHELTQHYDELAQYIPEFGRLKQLSKVSSIIRILNNIKQENLNRIGAINYLLNGGVQPDKDAYDACLQDHKQNRERITLKIKKLQSELSLINLRSKWQEKLHRIIEEMGSLKVDEKSPEVDKLCKQVYKQSLATDPQGLPFSWLWGGISYILWKNISKEVTRTKLLIAQRLTGLKQQAFQKQLAEILLPFLKESLDSFRLPSLIDSFIRNNDNQLAYTLADAERKRAIKEIQKEFPDAYEDTIDYALHDSKNAIEYLADSGSRHLFQLEKDVKEKRQEGFNEIGLGKEEKEVDLSSECLWVPASIKHEVKETPSARQLLFVYGGVNIQPKLKVINQKIGPNGELLERSRDISRRNLAATRYTTAQLNNGQAKVIPQGNRKAILRQERAQIKPILKEGLHQLNPKDIKFTQPNVSPNFKNGAKVHDLVNDLRSGKISPNNIEPIRVVQKDGVLWSLDNRRLFAYNLAGVQKIPVTVVSLQCENIREEFEDKHNPIDKIGNHVVVVGRKDRNLALDLLAKLGKIMGIHRGKK